MRAGPRHPMKARAPRWVIPPTFGLVGPAPSKPGITAVLREWMDAVAFWRNPARGIPAAYAAYHLITAGIFIGFLATHFTPGNLLAVTAIASGIGTIYNTVWYHRYCSHRAFRFRHPFFARIFLWTNPICFREESYAIPHRIHHSRSDEPGDPYGPHLGWLGSYLATESQQKMNTDVSPEEYERLARSLDHIGFVKNAFDAYRRTGSVENVAHYAARVLVVNTLWPGLAYAVAGFHGVLAWISGVFLFTFVVRDFNFRGHSTLIGSSHAGHPVNQWIYGWIAGEWHGNHHTHPRLAQSGLEWWQIDIPFWIIRLMAAVGIVTHYNAYQPGAKPESSPADPTDMD